MKQRKVLVVLGTRPEAVKLAPLVAEMRARSDQFAVRVCSTGQHRELLADALQAFSLRPDVDLALMQPEQDLGELLARILAHLGPVVAREAPDCIVVQGDTSSALGGCLAGYYAKVPVAHVEAGLRSGDPLAPFPEEQHRVVIDRLASWCFAPTDEARDNLLREGTPSERIWVTGNTGVDALYDLRRQSEAPGAARRLDELFTANGITQTHIIAATIHRREHTEGDLMRIAEALAELARHPNTAVVMPIHPNPFVRSVLETALATSDVHRVDRLGPVDFVGLLRRSAVVVTDSGGVQEEAATLGVAAVLARRRSDRPESVHAGLCRVVGPETRALVRAVHELLDAPPGAITPRNTYGDGRAAVRIADVLGLS